MAYGDIGGAVTELVLTCQTRNEGVVAIAKGDPLALIGNYTITNDFDGNDAVFGQSLASADRNSQTIPVKVKGVCIFTFEGDAPSINDTVRCGAPGTVRRAGLNGTGIVLKVDEAAQKVHVLI